MNTVTIEYDGKQVEFEMRLSEETLSIIKDALSSNPDEMEFGTESFNWITVDDENWADEENEMIDYGYIYPKGNGYGNMATYISRSSLEDALRYRR